MTRLSINLNKIALLRNQRDVGYPDVLAMGRQALEAGANGLTVHPRPDRRHIRVEDVAAISELCNSWSDAEYNIEGYPDDDWLALVLRTKPDQATLVPDSPAAKTSDCGWDLKRGEIPLRNALDQLVPAGIRVSIFMDYDATNLAQLAEWGAARIELYTGPYARAKSDGKDLLTSYLAAADLAHSAGLGV
ncbi:MAG: pyridoxine 5'-phosphate synthase, partial [Pseudomonadota bacterium]